MSAQSWSRFQRFVCLLAAMHLLAACAVPATSEGMIPTAFATTTHHPYPVAIKVTGGEESDGTHPAQISNETMRQAVSEAIRKSALFSDVAAGGGGPYLLSVDIFRVQQPTMGFSMHVNMEAGWTLTRTGTNKVVWRQSIVSDYTASPGDHLIGAERLRLATEGAARQNIRQALEALSRLDLAENVAGR